MTFVLPSVATQAGRGLRAVALVLAVPLSVAACAPGAPPAPSAAAAPSQSVASGDEAARQYCTDGGGMLVDRTATWNTNGDPSTWLELAGQVTYCEFEETSGDAPTRISVDLTTLSSSEPTLAALAYLSPLETTSPPQAGTNPAAWSCTEDFEGTSAYGNTAAGGGWVDASQDVFVVMNLCVFADGSAIDEFGLWYHANGVIRGAELAPLLRYQPGDRLPAIYQRERS